MDDNSLSAEDKEFLDLCEEEFKDRYTEKDEEFMKVFNKEPSIPPILEKWWAPYNGNNRRNDRRYNRRYQPYERNRDHHGRGNSDHRGYNDHNSSYGSHHSRYSNN